MRDWIENSFNSSLSGDLRFYYSGIREHSLNHHYGPRLESHYLLNFVYEGSADFWCRGKKCQVSAGTFYVMFPDADQHYQTKKDTAWSIQWVIVDGKQVEAFLSELGLTPENPFLRVEDPQRLKETFDHIFEYTKADTMENKMLCFSWLYRMFAQLLEQKDSLEKFGVIRRAEEYIRLHLTENLTVSQIAGQFYLNANYFTKLFKSELGVTPLHYINQKRVEKGKYLLEHTRLGIGEIAGETGFTDELYFSRVFRKYVGISPLAYRKKLLGTPQKKT